MSNLIQLIILKAIVACFFSFFGGYMYAKNSIESEQSRIAIEERTQDFEDLLIDAFADLKGIPLTEAKLRRWGKDKCYDENGNLQEIR